jgi:ribosome biogenesis GTPase
MYKKIGYETIHFSITEDFDPKPFINLMKDKVSLISGNSGVGKSSLLNALNPSLNLKTEEISNYHQQGKHITTYPEMHPMPFGGFVIDTPGIRGFGVVDMERNEIYHFFPEIFKASDKCRFGRCLHLDEPECAVKKAVTAGEIDPLRYRSYVNIMETDDKKYR